MVPNLNIVRGVHKFCCLVTHLMSMNVYSLDKQDLDLILSDKIDQKEIKVVTFTS